MAPLTLLEGICACCLDGSPCWFIRDEAEPTLPPIRELLDGCRLRWVLRWVGGGL